MKETGFIINLLGKLDERKIQRQVNKVIKRIEKTINMLQITATLAKGDTKKNLNDYIKWIQSQLNHVELTTELGSKNQKGEADKALNIDVLNIDGDKTKQKAQKAIADAKAEEEGKPISIGINYDARRSKLEKEFTVSELVSYLNVCGLASRFFTDSDVKPKEYRVVFQG